MIVETESIWEGRVWVDWTKRKNVNEKFKNNILVKFLSYHVLADFKCTGIRHTTSKSWFSRSSTLLGEIKCIDADIICLQDVDHFKSFWQPQLMILGYDCIWKQRTRESDDHYEGVVIAFKREVFQMFKTVEVELNSAWLMSPDNTEMKERLRTDDVGLIAFLQPWGATCIRSALCVGCCMFNDSDTDTQIRNLQCKYFVNCIELANRDFQLPVVMGLSLHDEPDSDAYHLLRTGRTSLEPQIPGKCKPPRASFFCRGSCTLYWYPPFEATVTTNIINYKIAWRPGGSQTLGFKAQIIVPASSCIQYVSKTDENGIRRTIAQKERSWVITGLTSEIPYEFKILAINKIGEGPWSEISEPIVLANPTKAPAMPSLVHLKSLDEVRLLREVTALTENDWDVEAAIRRDVTDAPTQTTPRTFNGKPDRQISKARVLPLSTNPRQGWSSDLHGGMSTKLQMELQDPKNLIRSVMRNESGFSRAISDTGNGKVAMLPHQLKHGHDSSVSHSKRNSTTSERLASSSMKSSSRKSSMLHGSHRGSTSGVSSEQDGARSIQESVDKSGEYPILDKFGQSMDLLSLSFTSSSFTSFTSTSQTSDSISYENSQHEAASASLTNGQSNFMSGVTFEKTQQESNEVEGSESDSDWELEDEEEEEEEEVEETDRTQEVAEVAKVLGPEGELARELNDDILIDGIDILRHIGEPNPRQQHFLNLRSAYESYSCGGEPLFTESQPNGHLPNGVRCTDYVFYSSFLLRPRRILAIPTLSQLQGDNPLEPLAKVDSYYNNPPPSMRSIFRKQYQFKNMPSSDQLHALSLKSVVPSRTQVDSIKKQLLATLSSECTGKQYWAGEWLPFSTSNPRRNHYWLPNNSFASTHISLCVEFFLLNDFVASEWT